jgi:hypothetical protein
MKVTVVGAPVHGRMVVDVHVLPQAEVSMVTNVPEHQLRKYCGTTEYIWRINSGRRDNRTADSSWTEDVS